ncbi:MAG: hypothetical protein EXR29_16940 [Betaproteobacteria bacterium]|nr:hypothetical protein [Betaproteobacteria bacterium]
MERIRIDSLGCLWPDYPHAVVAGGFCFISGVAAIDASGELIGGWDDLTDEDAPRGSGFAFVDAQEGPVSAQLWMIYRQLQSLLGTRGGSLDDLLRIHSYQKDKRYFPLREKIRMHFEPARPAPSSGVGISGGSRDPDVQAVTDGIALDARTWPFPGRRTVSQAAGALPSASHYSQAIEAGPYIFLAGQIPIDSAKPGKPLVRTYEDIPPEGRFLQVGRSHSDARNGPIAAQAWFTYNHIRHVLEGAGSRMEDIVNVTVFLQDIRDFHTFHEVHRHFFRDSVPALTVTEFREVGHKGSLIETEVTALRAGSALERKTILRAGDLTPGCHASLATLAGPLVYLSGLFGAVKQGRVVEDRSALPQSLWREAAAIGRVTGRPAAACQAIRIFEDLNIILGELQLGLSALAKLTLHVEDFADFVAFDYVCRHYLRDDKPALSCIAIPRVSPVPGARMCVEAIAVKE